MKSQNAPRKIGELQAFATVGLELLERSGVVADVAYGDTLAELRRALQEQLSWTTPRADQQKAGKTILKLREMMERYIADEWHNPVELLEWSGFYFGAAAVHWSLVAGMLDEADEPAAVFAANQVLLCKKWLDVSLKQIKSI